jgi:hypothetical protein
VALNPNKQTKEDDIYCVHERILVHEINRGTNIKAGTGTTMTYLLTAFGQQRWSL